MKRNVQKIKKEKGSGLFKTWSLTAGAFMLLLPMQTGAMCSRTSLIWQTCVCVCVYSLLPPNSCWDHTLTCLVQFSCCCRTAAISYLCRSWLLFFTVDNLRPDIPPLITAHNFTLFVLQNLLASPESQEAAAFPTVRWSSYRRIISLVCCYVQSSASPARIGTTHRCTD